MRAKRKAIASRNSTQGVPQSFQQALRHGYSVESETSKLTPRGRTGEVRLRSSSGHALAVPYEADQAGRYRFGKPAVRR